MCHTKNCYRPIKELTKNLMALCGIFILMSRMATRLMCIIFQITAETIREKATVIIGSTCGHSLGLTMTPIIRLIFIMFYLPMAMLMVVVAITRSEKWGMRSGLQKMVENLALAPLRVIMERCLNLLMNIKATSQEL